jgi:alkyl hydroperoxide reductase subunit D
MENEKALSLLNELQLNPQIDSISINKLAAVDSRTLSDIKLNFTSVMGSNNFTSKKESYLLALSVAINEKHTALMQAFEQGAINAGANEAEIAETHACVSVMVTNNIFYRFRHFMHGTEFYQNHPAGMRMSVMMNPVLGKEFFELMSLVLSAVNGCERCVTSHEASVKQHGASEPRIYDAMRLAAVIKSICVII